MPELPEVETVCRMLAKNIVGQSLVEVKVLRRDLRWPVQLDFEENSQGCSVVSVWRRGKYIIIELTSGSIIWHLGMSGVLRLYDELLYAKHDHVWLRLSDGRYLVYNDPRRFGSVYWALAPLAHVRLAKLGLEPLAAQAEPKIVFKLLQNRSKNIKDTIMDANLIVGVGNIYANEALFMSRIHPRRPAGSLSLEEVQLLLQNIQLVLKKAIAQGGTTLSDYVSVDGKPGYFKQELQVYGRFGQQCNVCAAILEKLAGFARQTVACTKCQLL